MKVVYADPPYIGQAKKHYKSDEIDHQRLIDDMERKYDGWALSLSSPTLKIILPMCPDNVRIGAWVKPFCSFKPNVNPAYAWEPVIFKPARERGRDLVTSRDWISTSITLQKGLVGAKPKVFCYWLFEILGMQTDDEFVDLFPGTGVVTDAWGEWCNSMELKI